MRDPVASPNDVVVSIRPPLVIGCGALAPELVELTRRAGLPAMDLTCLPASLHNRPERIPGAVAARIRRARADGYDRIFVAYADCGTGGLLDRVLEAEGVARLEGAHCYEVYAGRAAFAALADEEPGTFYLTDFLVRNFERLVVRGLGLDRHPELLSLYFGNYRRLVYLAQADDASLSAGAEAAAATLGLTYERRLTGPGELASAIEAFSRDAADVPTRGTATLGRPTSQTPDFADLEPIPPQRKVVDERGRACAALALTRQATPMPVMTPRNRRFARSAVHAGTRPGTRSRPEASRSRTSVVAA
jgi:hypothetical protein